MKEKKETIDSLLMEMVRHAYQPGATNMTISVSGSFGANGNNSGTDTIDFIKKQQRPSNKKGYHGNSYMRSPPAENRAVMSSTNGCELPYDDDASHRRLLLLSIKLIINSTTDADKGARFMTADLKDHFRLPDGDPEFMRNGATNISLEAILKQYNLDNLVTPDA
jgi:hypothetical protein